MALSGNFSTNKYTTSSHGTIGLNLSWTATQDVAANQSTIKWTLKSNGTMSSGYYVQGGPISAYINGTRVFYQSGRFNVKGDGGYKKTGTIVVNHNEDGSKNVAMSISAALYSTSQNCTGSKTFTLDKINRYAVITDAQDFNDTDNPVINYNNYAGELVDTLQACISLDGTTDNIAYRDISKLGDSYTFNLTSAERNTLLSATPNSNTLNVYFIVKTVISGNTFYSSSQKVMTVVNAAPTITSPAYLDTNPTTTAITLNNQQIIQNISTVSFTFGALTALKSSTLVSIDITVNAVTVSDTLSGSSVSSEVVSFGVINSASDLNASIKVTDSRGNSTTINLPITMLSWSLPTAIITCERRNNFYAETLITVDGSISSLDSKNTMEIKYRYKEQSSQSWSAYVTIQDNTQASINAPTGLDNTKNFDIQVLISDKIGSTTYNLTVNKGIPLAMFDKLRSSVGIDCLPSADNTLEIGEDLKVNGDTDIGGDLDVTGDISGANVNASGDLGITGDGSIGGDSTIGGDLAVTGDITAHGVVLPHKYDTSEHIVGYWIDGSPIYERTIQLSDYTLINANSYITVSSDLWNETAIPVFCIAYNFNGATAGADNRYVWSHIIAQINVSTGVLQIFNTRSSSIGLDLFTIQYVKVSSV